MPRDLALYGSVQQFATSGPWSEVMRAPVILGIACMEPAGIRVGSVDIARNPGEALHALIVRVAHKCGSDLVFELLCEDKR